MPLLPTPRSAGRLLDSTTRSEVPDTPTPTTATVDTTPTPAVNAEVTPSPEATASLWSRLFFLWLSPMLATGASRTLKHEDLFDLLPNDTALHNANKLATEWAAVRRRGGSSYLRAAHAAYGAAFWRAGVLKLINDVAIFASPWLIYRITDYCADNTLGTSTALAYAYAVCMFVALVVLSVAMGQYFMRGFRLGLNFQVGVAAEVFSKALVLTYEEQQRFGIGAIVSYMQVDAMKLADALPYMHQIWSGPLQIIVSLGALYRLLGPAGFGGLFVMVVLMPVNVRLARLQAAYTKAIMEGRDARVTFLTELLNGIRTVKLFAWEAPMVKTLLALRAAELSVVRTNAIIVQRCGSNPRRRLLLRPPLS